MEKPWTIEDRVAYLEKRIAVLERMVKVNQLMASTLDLHQLLDIILQVATELIETQAGSIMLLNKDTGELYVEATTGISKEDAERFTAPLEGSISGWVLTHNEPLVISNPQDAPHYYSLIDREIGLVTRSLMAAPLSLRGESIGVISVLNRLEKQEFTDQDMQTLLTLATQAAIAIENTRLFEAQGQAFAALDRVNRQLHEMDRLKSAFIGVISHELRSPFANVDFSLQLLERQGLERLPPEQREPLEQVVVGIRSAKTMVDNLVTFASFLAKQGELRLSQLNFGKTVQDAIAPFKPLAEGKDIALHIGVPGDLPPVYGDRERLSDAVHHLVHNAIKFTEVGGQVWIRCWGTVDRVHFQIKDTGVGVPADKLPTLWEGFAQMADPLRRGIEGLGLGLTLVKYIVSAHGGQAWAHSEEGIGSTFGFRIPWSGPENRVTAELTATSRTKNQATKRQ